MYILTIIIANSSAADCLIASLGGFENPRLKAACHLSLHWVCHLSISLAYQYRLGLYQAYIFTFALNVAATQVQRIGASPDLAMCGGSKKVSCKIHNVQAAYVSCNLSCILSIHDLLAPGQPRLAMRIHDAHVSCSHQLRA